MTPFTPVSQGPWVPRRRFLGQSVAWAAASLAGFSGCTTSPVTGESILVGMSEANEVAVDRQVAPQQFSADLGAVQDEAVNRYVSEVGASLASRSHRPQMPYSYRVLNANYVNAYTFPGGSMGLTRAILLEMDDEAQLAALLGHEIGHVNARHAAQRQGSSMVAQVAVAGLAIAADARYGGGVGQLVGLGGQLGASAMLASYSRDNEREADALGMAYMTRAGYSPQGMVGLMGMLNRQHTEKPDVLTTMFSSHPMSDERLRNMETLARSHATDSRKVQRERYMDTTAGVRRLRTTIESCQKGEVSASRQNLPEAEKHLRTALSSTPRDYAANVLMGRVLMAQSRHADAQNFLTTAKAVYPGEAQALKMSGTNLVMLNKGAAALPDLQAARRFTPGDSGLVLATGLALDQSGQRAPAAREYQRFLQAVPSGQLADVARGRLTAMGFR